ncbi:MAG TPA: AtpZ/AtpI family protein [Nocardioidaceae bacterium]|jgi:ATP synthase protein I|nr:AtpZ/AtpI family protein [Nocardioidaceae bacterium]
MTQQNPDSAPDHESSKGDPWHAFGYLVAGVGMYGFLGWLADRWLGTSFLVVVGILVGAGLGLYMTFARFNRIQDQQSKQEKN